MKKKSSAAFTAFMVATSAHAVAIDEATFKYYGGDTSDVANSIKTHNDTLRSFSYQSPWLTVGNIGECTGTWLGDKDGQSYILAAAHCVKEKKKLTEFDQKGEFMAWNGRVIASGKGTAYILPQRINIPQGLGGASTDIAILKLPAKERLVDANGRPVERPILNDAQDEVGRDVIYVGYGAWAVGTQNNAFWPATGDRRLYARSRISRTFETDHGIGADYISVGPSQYWAQPKSGDSGSAWWQIRGGTPVIIATTNGGSGTLATGARVSSWVDWIKSIYPEARFLSAEQPQGCIVAEKTGARYCLKAGEQANALPSWIDSRNVHVDAAPGTAVVLSDSPNLPSDRIATFIGTVEKGKLKDVKASNGASLDFRQPRSMRVVRDSTPLGCITNMTSAERYCLPAGKTSGYSLPDWVYGQEVQVEADPGTAVQLSDWDNLSYNRVAEFSGFVQNWELKKVKAYSSEELDFSRPKSMRVVQN